MDGTTAPTLLAIDTAGESCGLAVLHAGEVAAWQGEPGRTHLEDVLPAVRGLLERCGLRPADCDAFAFACGPGAFTGLRVACTVVQGLALGTGRPVLAVPHFDCLAQALPPPGAAGPRRAVALLDARMQQAYWASYAARDGGWHAAGAPQVLDGSALARRLADEGADCCVGDVRWLRGYIPEGSLPLVDAAIRPEALVRLALARFVRGERVAPEHAVPLYVRDRVAQTVQERLQERQRTHDPG